MNRFPNAVYEGRQSIDGEPLMSIAPGATQCVTVAEHDLITSLESIDEKLGQLCELLARPQIHIRTENE